jgi:hypothetical protein
VGPGGCEPTVLLVVTLNAFGPYWCCRVAGGDVVSGLTTRELTETEWNRWDDWLAEQPWGSPFSSAWWLDANCRAFGGRPLLLGVFDGEGLAGGVALRVRDVGFVHMTGFYIVYNPIVMGARNPTRRRQVLGALLDEIARRRLVIPSLGCTPDIVDLRQAVWHHWGLAAGWTVVSALKTWTLETSVSSDERLHLKKAHRSELVAGVEPIDADILCDLEAATMVRQRVKSHQSTRQLRTLIDSIGSHGMQIVVRDVDGTPLSTGITMFHGTQVAYGLWCGTSPIGLTKDAAVAMTVLTLQELQARGYEYFDWCGANLPGISDFKLEFGGTLTTSLAISRQPLWFKTAFAGYHTAKRIRGLLRGGGHDHQG